MTKEAPIARKRAPVPIPKWEIADAAAIQALERGSATPEQQQRSLRWIIEAACLTYDMCDKPDNDRLCAIFDGRRFSGLQIVKLLKLNLSLLKRKEA